MIDSDSAKISDLSEFVKAKCVLNQGDVKEILNQLHW
jgi:hypothetical protein